MHIRIVDRFPLVFWAITLLFFVYSGYHLWQPASLEVNPQFIHFIHGTVLLIALSLLPRQGVDLSVRLFWFCCTVALGIWIAVKAILIVGLVTDWEISQYTADFGYFAFFLVFLLSLQFYNAAEHQTNRSLFQQIGAVFFVAVLFIYLVIVPAQLDSTEFRNHSSPFLFFILMDAYLILAFVYQAYREKSRAWRLRFNYLALSFAAFLVLDSVEFLAKLGIWQIPYQKLWELAWFIPYFGFALAFNPSITDTIVKKVALYRYWPTSTAICLLLLPAIHIIGYSSGVFDEASQTLREFILLLWCSVFLFSTVKFVPRKRTSGTSVEVVEIQDEPENLQADAEHIPFAYFKLDSVGRVLINNTKAEQLVGYASEQMQGKFFVALLDKDEPLEQLLRLTEGNFIKSGLVTDRTHEAVLNHADGQKLVCHLAFTELPDNSISVNVVDVSSLKESEAHVIALKEKFLANITHEFRTPLTIIQGAIEAGLALGTTEVIRNRFVAAKNNTARVLKLVDQLLVLSKVTSAPKLELQVQPVSEIVSATCQQFAPLCQSKNIQFEFNVISGKYAKIHEDSLQQILSNLLSNAYKYSEHDGAIKLSMSQNENMILLSIKDTGCGMDEVEQQQLFNRFQRAGSAQKSKVFGVGIGLSLVSELVQSHDWHMSVNSAPEQGSEFIIQIPNETETSEVSTDSLTIDFDVPEKAAQVSPSIVAPDAESTQNLAAATRLLLIEDNLDMQDYLHFLLSPHFSVEIVGTGLDGVTTATSEVPDIIICDLMLPDITGYEVIESIKANPVSSHIPILMLTAKTDIESKIEGLSRQADDFLTKPFNSQELNLRLNNLLKIRDDVQKYLKGTFKQKTVEDARKAALPDEVSEQAITPHADFVEKLQKATESHYATEQFNLSQLASLLAMSERQLQRKLNAALGMSPGEYLREFRLIKSKLFLQQNIAVGQVSERVGFSSQAYFTKCFKEAFGITPSEFQKQTSERAD